MDSRALRPASVVLACIVVAATAAACSGNGSTTAAGADSGADGGGGGEGGDGGGGGGGESGTIDGIPFGEQGAFNGWLQTGEYTAWPHESAPHDSTGPHGDSVQTYLNPKLDGSLTAGNEAHPAGSAAVKEFFTNGAVSGWAAMVKTQEDSAGGDGWYWYEVFDADPGATAAFQGLGHPTCKGCHSAGSDFVRIPHPLQ